MCHFRKSGWIGFLAVGIGLCVFISCTTKTRNSQNHELRIAVVYLSQHQLITQIVDGFRDQIKTEMNGTPYTIIEKHASGDMSALSPMVNGVLAQGPSLIAPISTPVSQVSLKNAPGSIPICFLGVTDPVGAGIVKSLDHPETSTGVVDLPPFRKILGLIRQILPNAKSIGFPYSPDEQPAIFSRDQILKLAPEYGFTVTAKPVASVDELAATIRTLAKSNDVLLTGADNKMFDQSPQVAKMCLDARKPFFAGDSTSIKAGAVAGYSVDYREVGKEGAKLAVRILRGEKAGTIPVTLLTTGNLELNEVSARRLGITMPDEVLKNAVSIYK